MLCFLSSKVEHSTDNRETLDRYHQEAPVYGPIAQLVEQGTLNPFVVGSNPSRSTIQKEVDFVTLSGYIKCVSYGAVF